MIAPRNRSAREMFVYRPWGNFQSGGHRFRREPAFILQSLDLASDGLFDGWVKVSRLMLLRLCGEFQSAGGTGEALSYANSYAMKNWSMSESWQTFGLALNAQPHPRN
jgi:hypothetical protein